MRAPVQCGHPECGWKGRRKHVNRKPCPRCGALVVLQLPHGGVYLLGFFDQHGQHVRFQHAMHYLGYVKWDLAGRVHYHRTGNGSRLVAAVRAAGLDVRVVRTWPGLTRNHERRMKRNGTMCPRCPLCAPEWRVKMRAYRKAHKPPAVVPV